MHAGRKRCKHCEKCASRLSSWPALVRARRRRRNRPQRTEDGLVLLHRQVGLAGRVPRSLSAQPLSDPEGNGEGRPVPLGEDVRAREPWRWPRRLDLRGRARSPATRPATPTEEAIVARLYPDRAKLQKEEQRRFELLVAHWDVAAEPHRPEHAQADAVAPGSSRQASLPGSFSTEMFAIFGGLPLVSSRTMVPAGLT